MLRSNEHPAQAFVAMHADRADLYPGTCRGYGLIQSWMHHKAILVWNAQDASQIGEVRSDWKLCRPRQVIRHIEHLHGAETCICKYTLTVFVPFFPDVIYRSIP